MLGQTTVVHIFCARHNISTNFLLTTHCCFYTVLLLYVHCVGDISQLVVVVVVVGVVLIVVVVVVFVFVHTSSSTGKYVPGTSIPSISQEPCTYSFTSFM